jgi:tRNA(Ile)-lysidine synthase
MIFSQVDTILQQICPSGFKKPVLIGVSGGPDSLCLLDIAYRLGYPLIAAHFNHGLRPEADADAAFVDRTGATLGVRVLQGKEDVAGYAREHKLTIEEAARLLRYRFLFTQARLNSAQAVAVAHTADDQVETVIMHFLRGSGLSGLKGMVMVTLPNPWSQEIPLIRPLLSSWREEIVRYCQDRRLEPVEDRTNLDTAYHRNRLRHELIPFLERFNPQIGKVIWRTAQTLSGDDEILAQAVWSAWEGCLAAQGPGYLAFHHSSLLMQPRGMQRRLVRRGIDRVLSGLDDIGFDIIENAVNFINTPSKTASLSLAAGMYLLLEGDRLWLAAWETELPGFDWPQASGTSPIYLDAPGETPLPHGWRLKTDRIATDDLPASFLTNLNDYQAWSSAECLHFPLSVRPRRPGDRYQPLGMEGKSQKVSDLMINAKLPRRARKAWPLVCSGEDIIWIPGQPIAHRFRIQPGTRQVLYLQMYKS